MLYAKFLFKFFLCLHPAATFTLKIFSDIYYLQFRQGYSFSFLSWVNINFTINPSALSLWKKNNNNNKVAKIKLFNMISTPCVGEINQSKSQSMIQK